VHVYVMFLCSDLCVYVSATPYISEGEKHVTGGFLSFKTNFQSDVPEE
jgi:hypothetical protein